MTTPYIGVSEHYTVRDLGNRILSALKAAGKDLDALTVDDLAPVDEFHIRGREATVELSELADIQSTDDVIDIGCGVGGPSRFIAATTGCNVVGLPI